MNEENQDNQTVSSLYEAVKTINQLKNEDVSVISRLFLLSEPNFIDFQEVIKKIEESDTNSKFTLNNLTEIFNVLIYLQTQLGYVIFDEDKLRDNLPKLLEVNGFTNFSDEDIPYDKIVRLYAEIHPERVWHENAVIDSQVDFDSFIDIRPVFKIDNENEDNKITYSEQLIMIIFRLATRDDFGNIKSQVFQMNELGFRALEKEVEILRNKLEIIKSDSINLMN